MDSGAIASLFLFSAMNDFSKEVFYHTGARLPKDVSCLANSRSPDRNSRQRRLRLCARGTCDLDEKHKHTMRTAYPACASEENV